MGESELPAARLAVRPLTVRSRWARPPSLTAALLRPTLGGRTLWLVAALAIIVSLLLGTLLVYRTGGTQYTYPYLILLPLIFAAAMFKVPGGLLAGLAAGLLLGPWMPLNVEAGTMQSLANWLVRLGIYLVIGGFAGALATAFDFVRGRAIAQARIDPISGLVSLNTARQLAVADSAWALGYRPEHVVVVDFDGYDGAALALGAEVGHAAIRSLAHALSSLSGEDILVTRLRDACFGVLLPGGKASMARFLDRCRQRIPRTIEVEGVALTLLPRYGIARLTEADRNAREPFRKALVALRSSRASGRRVARYRQALDAEVQDNLLLLGEFRPALEQGQCDMHFQPKIDLATGRVFGAEALFRWHSPERGAVPPDRLIAVIENTELIHALSRFVIERSVRALADWRRQHPDIGIAINLSMRNFEDEGLLDFLMRVPSQYRVPPQAIELELTETALMRQPLAMRRTLDRLRDLGFTLTVDDFGSGHASLAYLKDLPIDWVKLDRAFVKDLPHDPASREIAAATVAMCRGLGYRLVAEGVENAETLNYLGNLGYHAAQGYYIARPLPEVAFRAWLADRGGAGEGGRAFRAGHV